MNHRRADSRNAALPDYLGITALDVIKRQRAVVLGELGAADITEMKSLAATRCRDCGKSAARIDLAGWRDGLDAGGSVGVDTAI